MTYGIVACHIGSRIAVQRKDCSCQQADDVRDSRHLVNCCRNVVFCVSEDNFSYTKAEKSFTM